MERIDKILIAMILVGAIVLGILVTLYFAVVTS